MVLQGSAKNLKGSVRLCGIRKGSTKFHMGDV